MYKQIKVKEALNILYNKPEAPTQQNNLDSRVIFKSLLELSAATCLCFTRREGFQTLSNL